MTPTPANRTTSRTGRPSTRAPRAPRVTPPAPVPHLSVAERVARGKAARAEVPRSSHGVFELSPTRKDPLELLEL